MQVASVVVLIEQIARAGGVEAFMHLLQRVADQLRSWWLENPFLSGVNWTSVDPHAPHPNSIELLATIAAPTTVVIAALDVPCFHEMSDVLAQRIPGARKLTVPGVGHMVNMEAPETVNALLREVVLDRSLA